MKTLIHTRVELAQNNQNPTVICRLPSGWVVLGDTQFLSGYSLLLPDPVVADLNALTKAGRIQFLYDMSLVGDALLEVTGAWRINYDILGNYEPALHAHIVPRFLNEPEELRSGPPWSYFDRGLNQIPFNLERDQSLMAAISDAIQKRTGDILSS